MLDVRRLRNELDSLKAGLARKGVGPAELDGLAALDRRHRQLVSDRDRLRTEVNLLSQEVGALRRQGSDEAAADVIARSRALGDQAATLATEADAVAAELRERLLEIPNPPADDAPDGSGTGDNPVVRTVGGERTWAAHQRVPHWEIGTELGILDLERGAKLSGSMFVAYRGAGARLVRALVALGIDANADAFEEIRPPTLVRTETMVATGHLPRFADDAYHVARDDLWAVPTGEVPLTSLARDEILAEEQLPVRLMAHTSCFRREAGAAGRETRGLQRVHEFDKVEILAYTTPEQAGEVHAELVARAEAPLAALGLTYRVVDLCAGDLGFSARRCFDLEVYAPGCDQWLEVSSISWFGDFQARRANIRYRRAVDSTVEPVHTLNGSALAVPRVWAAVVEANRRPDGAVGVPEALRPHLGGAEVLAGPATRSGGAQAGWDR
ncbi:MAG: serine--tRNA ligase [Acidimicrobiales bacterium]